MSYKDILPRRIISNTQPLFHFKETKWEVIPEEFRKFSAIGICLFYLSGLDELFDNLDDYKSKNIPVVIQGEFYISYEKEPMLPPQLLKDISHVQNSQSKVLMQFYRA